MGEPDMGAVTNNWSTNAGVELDFTIQGMSCTACAARIEKALTRMDGVTEAAVSFPLRTAWVQVQPDSVSKEQLADKVGSLGFVAKLNESAQRGLLRERRALLVRLIASALLMLPLLAGMTEHVPSLAGVQAMLPEWLLLPWLQLLLASVMQFVIGMPFYFGAYYAIRQRSANMDVLVAIGTSAAYLYSHYILFQDGLASLLSRMPHGSALYFETSAVVMTAVWLGKYIEASASLKAQNESLGFEQLRVQSALVEREGRLEELRTEFVRKGDLVHVEPGALIPVDGELRAGESLVEEALLTGESAAVAKRTGDKVWAGTTNGPGRLVIATGAAGHDTMLSRIQALVLQGQRAKSSLQTQVDAASSLFVPVMLAASVVTFLLWGLAADPGNWRQAALCAITVLLAACPCALGLAAPISLVIASGQLARRGIIAKEAGAVERLAAIDTMLLDKTGTLTEGKPKLVSAAGIGYSRSSLIRLAASLEAEADHPLAWAIRQEAARKGIDTAKPQGVTMEAGAGVTGTVMGTKAAIGNCQWMMKLETTGLDQAQELAAAREALGETVLYVSRDGRCVGILSFTDTMRRDAAAMTAGLTRLGVTPVMVTGDHWAPARAAAQRAGIREVHASMLPEAKLSLVEKRRRNGKRIAMAGDGWNDAPALAASDVGIAMGNGTYGALNAGHMTLLFSRLPAIPHAIALSRQTIRNIRQNLAFALVYNACIIPVAALGLLQPWMAGTAMALSSVSVVCNALRLKARLERAEGGR
ncbi:cation-translocating P-type ATPase [Paenibacillus sp. PL2-23]|uniref:heavy metal translocating P-type ATPase n=1 Tax=Paenibacillus sp. PL2-23 TaxID=2100729 RepID=UPI0030F8F622